MVTPGARLTIALAAGLLASGLVGVRAASPDPGLSADSFGVHRTRHFVILSGAGEDPAPIGARLEAVLERFHATFAEAGFRLAPPPRPLAWIQFSEPREYIDYSLHADGVDMSWAQGYYSVWTNRVVLAPEAAARGPSAARFRSAGLRPTLGDGGGQISTTIHEAVHQIAFNCGLQARGVIYPVWATEGLSAWFESGEAAGSDGSNPLRAARLRDAARDSRLLPLAAFLTLTDVPAHDPVLTDAMYAQAWAVFRTLFREHPEELRRYYAALATLPPGPRGEVRMQGEIIEAFGSLERLERTWERALARELGER